MAGHVEVERSEIEAIRAREQGATEGPWRWYGNETGKTISLQSIIGLRMTVMTFWRWGMQGAMPAFTVDGILHAARTFFVRPEPHNDYYIADIDHPDAQFIEHSRQDVKTLLAEVDRLGEIIEWHESTQCKERCCVR